MTGELRKRGSFPPADHPLWLPDSPEVAFGRRCWLCSVGLECEPEVGMLGCLRLREAHVGGTFAPQGSYIPRVTTDRLVNRPHPAGETSACRVRSHA
jgi:hypothetical protein